MTVEEMIHVLSLKHIEFHELQIVTNIDAGCYDVFYAEYAYPNHHNMYKKRSIAGCDTFSHKELRAALIMMHMTLVSDGVINEVEGMSVESLKGEFDKEKAVVLEWATTHVHVQYTGNNSTAKTGSTWRLGSGVEI